VEFDSETDLRHFMDAAQDALRTRLEIVQQEMAEKSKGDVLVSYKAHLSDVIQALRSINPRAERQLQNLISKLSGESSATTSARNEGAHQAPEPFDFTSSLPASKPPLASGSTDVSVADLPFVEKRQMPGGRSVNFRRTQERILKHLTSKNEPKAYKSVEELSPLLRALLATVSFVPFAFYYPFSSRLPASTKYVVDLDGMRDAYKQVLFSPWADVFSRELQEAFRGLEYAAGSILESALETALQESTERLRSLSELPPTTIDGVTLDGIARNYCNLVAAQEAFESIATRLEDVV
jgi:hypothetical protein